MELDYSALTVEEMETLVKNLNEQIKMKRTFLIDGILREMYPYVAENSKLIKGVEKLPYELRNKSIEEMVENPEEVLECMSAYTEDLTLGDILALLRFAIESYHNNV